MSDPVSQGTFEVDAQRLRGGLVLLCIGGVVWLLGAVLSTSVLVKAAQRWIAQMEESPSEMAQRRLHQLKVAAAAGSKAWREEQTH